MATTQPAVKRTYEDYCATADDKRYELLNGHLMMVPAPNLKHQSILIRLGRELSRFTEEHGRGKVESPQIRVGRGGASWMPPQHR